MFLNYVDVVSLTTSPPQGVVKQLDSQLISIKRQVSSFSPGRAPADPPARPADRLCSVPPDSVHQTVQQFTEGENQLGSR